MPHENPQVKVAISHTCSHTCSDRFTFKCQQMPFAVLTYSYQPRGFSDTCRCPSHRRCRGLGHCHLPHLRLQHQARHQKKPDTACPLVVHIQTSPWGLETEAPATIKLKIRAGSTSLRGPVQARQRLPQGKLHPAVQECCGGLRPQLQGSPAASPTQPSSATGGAQTRAGKGPRGPKETAGGTWEDSGSGSGLRSGAGGCTLFLVAALRFLLIVVIVLAGVASLVPGL